MPNELNPALQRMIQQLRSESDQTEAQRQVMVSRQPTAYTDTPFGGPAPMAMIPTARNLPKFMELMKDALAKIKGEGLGLTPRSATMSEQARAFWEARHPVFAEKFPSSHGKGMGTISGYYKPLPEEFNAGAGNIYINPNSSNKVEDFVRTLGHETTHGIESVRNPENFRNSVADLQDINFSSRLSPADRARYLNNPSEILARKGGATALQEAQQYQDLIRQQLNLLK